MKKKNKKLDDWLDCLNEQNYTNEKEAIVNQNPIKKDLKSEVAKFQYHMYLVAYHHGINNENEKDEKVKLIMNTLGYAVPFRGDCVWFLYSDRAAKDISNALGQIHPLWGIAVVELNKYNNWVVEQLQFTKLAQYVQTKYLDDRFISYGE